MLQFDPLTREVMWNVSEIAVVFKDSLFFNRVFYSIFLQMTKKSLWLLRMIQQPEALL